MEDPSRDRLHELFHYDSESGELSRKIRVSNAHPGTAAGTVNSCGYRIVRVDGKMIGAHRIAWIMLHDKIPDGMEIDHIDCNPLNNRICNLRLASRLQNTTNRKMHKNNASGFKGVCMDLHRSKANPWRARIIVNKKTINLGMFPSPEEAHEAYKKAAVKHFGEFARF